jgi:hypothetical protein
MTTKFCTRCLQEKPTSAFWRCSRHPDGLAGRCKECDNEGRKMRRHGQSSATRRIGLSILSHCSICDLWKLRNEFYESKNGQLSSRCIPCQKTSSNAHYHNNPQDAIKKSRHRRQRRREEMVAAYGGACACCGETTSEFLTLDHIEGGGKAHQREVGGPDAIVRQLQKQGWPKDKFRLLCYNCNCAIGAFGKCPHQEQIASDRTFFRKPPSETRICSSCRIVAIPSRAEQSVPYCRECHNKLQRERRHLTDTGDRLPDIPAGMGVLKFCPHCRLFMVAAKEFWKHRGNSGLQSHCKRCSREISLARRHKDVVVSRGRDRAARLEAIAAYGGKCEDCGETEWPFLTIDHINGGGTSERRTPGLKGNRYHRLKRLGYPRDKFRLLCYNCNCSRNSGRACT